MSERFLIHLFKLWLGDTRCLEFTGRTTNYKVLGSYPDTVFKAFSADIDPVWLKAHYDYSIKTVAGALAKIYPLFRDRVLLQALREFRAEELGVVISEVPEMRYMYKNSASQTHMSEGGVRKQSPRAVLEWEAVKEIKPGMSRGNLGRYVEDECVSADGDVCAPFDVVSADDLEADYISAMQSLTGQKRKRDDETAPHHNAPRWYDDPVHDDACELVFGVPLRGDSWRMLQALKEKGVVPTALIKVVGTTFRKASIEAAMKDHVYDVHVEAETTNKHDENAMKILLGPHHVGYLRRGSSVPSGALFYVVSIGVTTPHVFLVAS